jgi:hypothetical protein
VVGGGELPGALRFDKRGFVAVPVVITAAAAAVHCPQVKQLAAYLTQREAEQAPVFNYDVATVTR